MLLLHVYHPAKRPNDQEETWRACELLQRGVSITTVHCPTIGRDGYWKALEMAWDIPDVLVVLEQDIVPTWEQVREVVDCAEGYCAFDFELAHGVPWSEVPGGHGFGLAKFDYGYRHLIKERPRVPHVAWPDTVPVLHERLGEVHVHRPCIKHNHHEP